MTKETKTEIQPQAQQAPKGPFVHQLRLYLVGGQQFTISEVTAGPEMPVNVAAFINAWRAKEDVWHSPNNDPRFGVRVRDVSLYEYRVARAVAQKKAASQQ